MIDINRDQLIALVREIMNAAGTESEVDKMISLLEAGVPHPNVSDLMFWPPDGVQLTPEQIVDEALAYRSVIPPSS